MEKTEEMVTPSCFSTVLRYIFSAALGLKSEHLSIRCLHALVLVVLMFHKIRSN